jgi:hypothetical protein
MNSMCHECNKKQCKHKDKGAYEIVPQLAFGRLIPKTADPENDTSSDYLIADQAVAAADSWAPSHCSADAANYYVAESAEDWLVVVVVVVAAAA